MSEVKPRMTLQQAKRLVFIKSSRTRKFLTVVLPEGTFFTKEGILAGSVLYHALDIRPLRVGTSRHMDLFVPMSHTHAAFKGLVHIVRYFTTQEQP